MFVNIAAFGAPVVPIHVSLCPRYKYAWLYLM